MTVAELIEDLKRHNPNLVVLDEEFFEISGAREEEIEDKDQAKDLNMEIGERYIMLRNFS